MALSTGLNLGQLVYGLAGEQHYTELLRLFRAVDVLVMPRVISATTTAPPASPTNGHAYIVPASATGAWSGQTGKIARWNADGGAAAWEFIAPKKGWAAWVDGSGKSGQPWRYNGTTWSYEYNVPTYADQTAAAAGGLLVGDLFKTSTGALMVKT